MGKRKDKYYTKKSSSRFRKNRISPEKKLRRLEHDNQRENSDQNSVLQNQKLGRSAFVDIHQNSENELQNFNLPVGPLEFCADPDSRAQRKRLAKQQLDGNIENQDSTSENCQLRTCAVTQATASIRNRHDASKAYPEKSLQMGCSTSNENILETFVFYDMSGAESQIEETSVKSEQTLECRACLQILNEDCVSYNIFEGWTTPWDGMENSIAEDLAKIANVQISESDRHSKIICETCCQLLLSACNFTATVKRNDEILRQRDREDKTQLNLSNDRLWPKPIQVDKSIAISMCENIDIKKEIVSDDEQYPSLIVSYDPSRDRLPHLIIQPQPSQLYASVYGNEKLDHLNTKESHLTNKNSDSGEITKSMMDQNDKLDDKLKQKGKLAKVCKRKYRKKKRDEAQQQQLPSQNEPKYDYEQIQQKNTLDQPSSVKKIEHAIDDTQIPGPSHGDPEFTIKDRRITVHNSQIPETSANMNIPIAMNDYSVNLSDSENNCAGPSQRTNNVIQAKEQSCVLLPHDEN